jgi:hypothetical protein
MKIKTIICQKINKNKNNNNISPPTQGGVVNELSTISNSNELFPLTKNNNEIIYKPIHSKIKLIPKLKMHAR